MNLVITVCTGDKYRRMAELTHPTIKAYADKIGAHFAVINDRKYPESISPSWEKLRTATFLEEYERIIYFDTDIIIRSDTPNLFDIVPLGKFGAFDEGRYIPERQHQFLQACAHFGWPEIDLKGRYFNAGVLVFDWSHLGILEEPSIFQSHFYEQSLLNSRVNNEQFFDIGFKFNRMFHMGDLFRRVCYVLHYAGVPDPIPFIKEDLEVWRKEYAL